MSSLFLNRREREGIQREGRKESLCALRNPLRALRLNTSTTNQPKRQAVYFLTAEGAKEYNAKDAKNLCVLCETLCALRG